jgi:predicted membrane protein
MSTTTKRRAFLGVLLILIGSLLLMKLAGMFHCFVFPDYLFSWKMILIALGVFLMATERNRSTGVILFIIGSAFLAKDVFNVDFWQVIKVLIPVLFVFAGVMLLLPGRGFIPRRRYNRISEEDVMDSIENVNVFSGGSKAITSENFRGGEVTCIFGGAELNFKNAKLAPGNNVLDVTCIFGGVTLYVPEDWTIKLDVTPVFGGFSDSRAESNMKLVTDPEKVLVINGAVIFGGGEIKVI